MNFENQCRIKDKFKDRLEDAKAETDFRSFNFSRWKAKNWLQVNQESFDTAGCPAHLRYRQYDVGD